ncbi:RING-type zinc-finger [Vigna unguiculata]|uniref:RING-type zinc-finger n=1 Tax=Vigna unguiculata TaxID=3917 RepID=A0A4D6LWB8_VIGUN|nr:RING-type zinc-finger [Vigna unguiculata]
MWSFASNCIAGTVGVKNDSSKPTHSTSECSDDETSIMGREEGLECPICWESFNIVENVPYVLWCGHTLCKNCILGLQWAVVKFPTLPVQLPLFISCPWCNLLSFRLVYRGNLKFPRKNYFLLWMVESMNGDRLKSHSPFCGDNQQLSMNMGSQVSHGNHRRGQVRHPEVTAKFPLVIIFLLIVLYAIPASAAILALLDWLVREIIA